MIEYTLALENFIKNYPEKDVKDVLIEIMQIKEGIKSKMGVEGNDNGK